MSSKIEVVQHTSSGGHRYYAVKKNGKEHRLTSVTTILKELDKPALIPWAVKSTIEYITKHIMSEKEQINENSQSPSHTVIETKKLAKILLDSKQGYRNVSDEACDIGTQVHALIEDYLKTNKKPEKFTRKEVENGFNSFINWANSNKFKMIESEIATYNIQEEFAGTIDCVAMLNGKKYLVDFKTSKGFYFPSFGLQLSAYVYAYNQLNPDNRIKGMGILRLDKATGIAEWQDMTCDAKQYLDMFLHLNNFYKIKCKLEYPI